MDEPIVTQQGADAINAEMVREMELRRQQRPERRQRATPREPERRRTCSYCYQSGDHPTPTHCLRALER